MYRFGFFFVKLSTLNLPVSHGFSSSLRCWWCLWHGVRKTSRGFWNLGSWTLGKASHRRRHWSRSLHFSGACFNLHKHSQKTHPLQVHTTLQALLDHTRTIKYIEMLLRHERKTSTRQRRRKMYLLTMVNKCMLLLIHLITKQWTPETWPSVGQIRPDQ